MNVYSNCNPEYPFDAPARDGAHALARIRALSAVTPRQGLPSRHPCASGQAGDLDLKAFRASLTARLHAQAAADRRALAKGGGDARRRGPHLTVDNLTPKEAYRLTMLGQR